MSTCLVCCACCFVFGLVAFELDDSVDMLPQCYCFPGGVHVRTSGHHSSIKAEIVQLSPTSG